MKAETRRTAIKERGTMLDSTCGKIKFCIANEVQSEWKDWLQHSMGVLNFEP